MCRTSARARASRASAGGAAQCARAGLTISRTLPRTTVTRFAAGCGDDSRRFFSSRGAKNSRARVRTPVVCGVLGCAHYMLLVLLLSALAVTVRARSRARGPCRAIAHVTRAPRRRRAGVGTCTAVRRSRRSRRRQCPRCTACGQNSRSCAHFISRPAPPPVAVHAPLHAPQVSTKGAQRSPLPGGGGQGGRRHDAGARAPLWLSRSRLSLRLSPPPLSPRRPSRAPTTSSKSRSLTTSTPSCASTTGLAKSRSRRSSWARARRTSSNTSSRRAERWWRAAPPFRPQRGA